MRTALLGAVASLLGACSISEPAPLTRYVFVETHMATPCRIVLYAADAEAAGRAARAAYAEIAAVDRSMNDWNPESEISRLSAAAGTDPRTLSEPLFEVLSAAKRFAESTGGAFDPTVGPLVRLWRQARKDKKLPDAEALRAARALVGHARLRLAPDRTARLETPGMVLDLGGIAKGFACDRALAALAREGIRAAFVDTGGGMALGDPPPDAPGWKIQLADETDRVLVLSRCGVATSGDWERYVEIDGVRYSHIVDPSTGLGLRRRELVTVVAPDGMSADALSTAVSVLGPDRGIQMAEALPGVEAWMRWLDGDVVRRKKTSAFPR